MIGLYTIWIFFIIGQIFLKTSQGYVKLNFRFIYEGQFFDFWACFFIYYSKYNFKRVKGFFSFEGRELLYYIIKTLSSNLWSMNFDFIFKVFDKNKINVCYIIYIYILLYTLLF